MIIITGASSGLGKALALRLSREHAKLVLLSRSADKLQDIAQKLKNDHIDASCFSCNITDYDQIRHTVDIVLEAHGRIDILINCAGILEKKPIEGYDVNTILDIFDVNAIGAICMTQAILPSMKKTNAGQIVNVISTAGLTASDTGSVYTATKHALEGFHASLKKELKDTGIRIMGFYPGGMEANLFTTSAYADVESELSRERDDVADMIGYMLTRPEYLVIDHLEVRKKEQYVHSASA